MNLLEWKFPKDDVYLDEAEEDLGKPDEAEASDLPMHVRRCSARWLRSYRQSKATDRKIDFLASSVRQTQILLILVALLIATGVNIAPLVKLLMGG